MDQASPAQISYRRSVSEDCAAVFHLVTASVRRLAPDPYPAEVVGTWMQGRAVEDYRQDCAGALIWIAEVAGRPVGFAHGEPGEVKRLFVDADFTGFGLGAGLMQRALADARLPKGGVVRIEATLNAVPFYQKWGFTEFGTGVFPGREGLPAIDIVLLKAVFPALDE